MLVSCDLTSLEPIIEPTLLSTGSITSTTQISTSASLKITMAIKSHAKSTKRTKYRPIERSDGVVVLQRPYHPATLPALKAPTFEKHVPTFAAPKPSTTATQETAMNRHKDDLTYLGSGCLDMGRAGDNEVLQAGRSGYNGICENVKNLKGFLEGSAVRETSRYMSPMQCFLDDAGPWSPHNLREQ
ncbi:hypothetical protein DE146DRAFT_643164 [Phaeosphaeria sp. MPI-PUGE-AT-0046c]|nr:hypothetical protein DE146DRAFT_643164 [Phaeosphaeria sp. MPI-PUGE-AT-0046c]